MQIRKAKVIQDYLNGVLEGEGVEVSKKLYKDAKSFYQKEDNNLDDDTVMYEVYSYSQGDSKQVGNLNWGLTVMKPLCVSNECNITRGHFHKDLNCAEIYFCLGGVGLLLLMDEKGNYYAEEMEVGTVHHIDGKMAHRLVNTGDVNLKVGACWPTTAGHDYERIESFLFPMRIFKKDGNIIVEERKDENRV